MKLVFIFFVVFWSKVVLSITSNTPSIRTTSIPTYTQPIFEIPKMSSYFKLDIFFFQLEIICLF